MLSAEETVEYFDQHYTQSAFRLETLDSYDVGDDGADVGRYLRGEAEPTPERKIPWLEELRSERQAGKKRHRVHVLRTPLSDYLRYECEWGYVPNAQAGEEIRILDLSQAATPPELLDEDYWLLDDQYVLRMVYDDGGKFLGAEVGDDPEAFLACKDAAIAASEDFESWWPRHPEYWRANMINSGS